MLIRRIVSLTVALLTAAAIALTAADTASAATAASHFHTVRTAGTSTGTVHVLAAGGYGWS